MGAGRRQVSITADSEVFLTCVFMFLQVGPCPITGVRLWGSLALVCRQKVEEMTMQRETMGFHQLDYLGGGSKHQVVCPLAESYVLDIFVDWIMLCICGLPVYASI